MLGIIAPADIYTKKYGMDFSVPGEIGAYPHISWDALDQNQKLEAVCKIRKVEYTLYDKGIYGASAFILAVIDDVWVCELRNPTKFYTNVLPSALLEHLKERCTGLHVINAIEVLLIIQGYYSDASIMPINVNILI